MRNCAIVAATLFFIAATVVRAQGPQSETVNGFLCPITGKQILAASQPLNVNLLSGTKTPKDALDLILMAKWSLNYLAGTLTPERDFASSYGNWPLKMPPYAIG